MTYSTILKQSKYDIIKNVAGEATISLRKRHYGYQKVVNNKWLTESS